MFFPASFGCIEFQEMRRLCRRFCATAEEQKPRVIFVSIPIAAVGVCIFSYVTREMYNANWFAKPRFQSSTFDEEKTFRVPKTFLFNVENLAIASWTRKVVFNFFSKRFFQLLVFVLGKFYSSQNFATFRNFCCGVKQTKCV